MEHGISYVLWSKEAGKMTTLSVFKVEPNVGKIAEDDFVLIRIRFTPQALKKYTE